MLCAGEAQVNWQRQCLRDSPADASNCQRTMELGAGSIGDRWRISKACSPKSSIEGFIGWGRSRRYEQDGRTGSWSCGEGREAWISQELWKVMGAQQRGGEECTCCLGKADAGKEKGHGGKNKEFWLSLVLGGGRKWNGAKGESEWGRERCPPREDEEGKPAHGRRFLWLGTAGDLGDWLRS